MTDMLRPPRESAKRTSSKPAPSVKPKAKKGNGEVPKNGNGHGNGNGVHVGADGDGHGLPPLSAARMTTPVEGLDRRELLGALVALKKGDFSVRLPMWLDGLDGKLADTFNDVIELNQRMSHELERLSRVVGKEGRISERASIGHVQGAWATEIASVNALISDLVRRRLVRRTRDRSDRRTYRLALTPAGTRLLAELTDCARRHEVELDRAVGRDRARFLKLLKTISADLE